MKLFKRMVWMRFDNVFDRRCHLTTTPFLLAVILILKPERMFGIVYPSEASCFQTNDNVL